jgi:hypothetical protein
VLGIELQFLISAARGAVAVPSAVGLLPVALNRRLVREYGGFATGITRGVELKT